MVQRKIFPLNDSSHRQQTFCLRRLPRPGYLMVWTLHEFHIIFQAVSTILKYQEKDYQFWCEVQLFTLLAQPQILYCLSFFFLLTHTRFDCDKNESQRQVLKWALKIKPFWVLRSCKGHRVNNVILTKTFLLLQMACHSQSSFS